MNYKLTLSYDGSRYNGWQRQGNTENTIQGKLESTLSRIAGENIEISGCGRTDAGVHALCQVCSFKTEKEIDSNFMLTELRKYLPEDIGALALEKADERFHARLSCVKKTYLYTVYNSELPDVFRRKYVYVFPEKTDIAEMEKAAALLMGKHDFIGFSSVKRSKKSTVRRLYEIRIEREGELLKIFLTGDGFLYNMVRIIVGTLLEVGTGRRKCESIEEIFKSGDRALAGFTAPAKGLTLYEVKYR